MDGLIPTLSQSEWLTMGKYFAQVLIIIYGILWVWRRIVGTQAERVVKGVFVLAVLYIVCHSVGFNLITSLLRHVLPVAAIASVVIFQPEIRRGLGYLGRMKTFRVDFSLADSEEEGIKNDIHEIVAAVKELSANKIGALIVIESPAGEHYYISPGTAVNADISSNLILSIFFPKSPLHDGAIVVRQRKIVTAGVILPITDNPKLSLRYGTRHRAALGLSEIYEGLCIVISEETGSISAASRGMLVEYASAEELAEPISYLFSLKTAQKAQNLIASLIGAIPFHRKLAGARPLDESAENPSKANDLGAELLSQPLSQSDGLPQATE